MAADHGDPRPGDALQRGQLLALEGGVDERLRRLIVTEEQAAARPCAAARCAGRGRAGWVNAIGMLRGHLTATTPSVTLLPVWRRAAHPQAWSAARIRARQPALARRARQYAWVPENRCLAPRYDGARLHHPVATPGRQRIPGSRAPRGGTRAWVNALVLASTHLETGADEHLCAGGRARRASAPLGPVQRRAAGLSSRVR